MSDGSRGSNLERQRAAIVSIGDGGVDLISGLNEDLLLRILDLVPVAENVVRTHALSRRWRGLWTGVTALRFDFASSRKGCGYTTAAKRYIAFVNGALALRATAAKEPAFVEDLAISFNIYDLTQESGKLVSRSVEAVQGWIRYAVQHGVKCLTLKLTLTWNRFIGPHVITRDEMDGYANMKTMHLKLDGVALLPSPAIVFSSLTDLSLEQIILPDCGGCLFSRLLSSACCPHLHKLRLQTVNFHRCKMEEVLRIEAGALLELSLESIFELQFLELWTPSLQVLHIDDFNLNVFTLWAPRLENFMFLARQPLLIDDLHGHLSSVRTLKIQLFSRGERYYVENKNDGSIHILQHCRSTRCLEVSFEVSQFDQPTDDLIKDKIPLLPHVTHLAVDIKLQEYHSTGPCVACLLAQCSNIKYLSLRLCYNITKNNQSELDLLCDNNLCHWKSHELSLLAHLQEVEFKKLIGTGCEFLFIQSILAKAIGIQKVTISFSQSHWLQGRKHAFKVMPPLDDGLWTTCMDDATLSYNWRRP